MLELVPFQERHLDAAAELLAARHRADREAEPLLPARYGEAVATRPLVEAALAAEGASGVLAVRDGRPAGFLIGQAQENAVRGRHAWIHAHGHAVGSDEPASLYADLYAAASRPWVEEGHLLHFAQVPAGDRDLLDAWFGLSFGQQQAYALRELAPGPAPDRRGLEITRGGPADIDELMPLGDLVHRASAEAPVYDSGPSTSPEDLRSDWEQELSDPKMALFLGRRDGRLLGFVGMYDGAGSNMELLVPEQGCSMLFLGATVPEVRGQGVGVALTEHALHWAAGEGFTSSVADWRSTNLTASRFWPRRGYRTAQLRLHRRLADTAPAGLRL